MSDTYTLTMDRPDARDVLDHTAQGIIGKPIDRPDGPAKVTGVATYSAEWRHDGMADGVLVLSTIGRGTVKGMNRDAVLAMDGVLAIIDDERFLQRPAQGGAGEAPVQGATEVCYYGQPIALVVAETFEQATAAANAVRVDYDDHTADGQYEQGYDGNRAGRPDEDSAIDQGDIDQAMKAAAYSVDATYTTEGHVSAAMEPHAAIAQWQGDRLTLQGSLQMLKFNLAELADSLGVETQAIRIQAPYVGGGFGSKLGISPECVGAAIAARDLGRPVRVVQARRHVMRTINRRSETEQRIRLAAGPDGVLTGIGHECTVSNLPEEAFAEPVTQATAFLYGGENRRMSVNVIDINRTTAGSVRAPGEAVGMTALESAMDELAEKVGIDPVELRIRNIPERHPSKDIPYSSRKLEEAMRAGAERFEWDGANRTPGQRREGDWWIGTGMATAARISNVMPAHARVRLEADGVAVVETDMTDIGTGTYAIFAQIAGEMLGLPPERVLVRLADTDFPHASGSGGSWGATSTGSAVFAACEKLRANVADTLGCAADALTMKDGMAVCKNRSVTLADLLNGEPMEVTGEFQPGAMHENTAQATYGAFFCEVAVNAYSGESRVRRMHGTFGIGRVLNEKTATSQCYGGMVWGIGSALTEELTFDTRDGHLVNCDLAEYHVPVNLDVPDLDVVLLEDRDQAASPLQSKGVGELAICGSAAAVANAIYNATGIRPRSFPVTLDKLLADLPDA